MGKGGSGVGIKSFHAGPLSEGQRGVKQREHKGGNLLSPWDTRTGFDCPGVKKFFHPLVCGQCQAVGPEENKFMDVNIHVNEYKFRNMCSHACGK